MIDVSKECLGRLSSLVNECFQKMIGRLFLDFFKADSLVISEDLGEFSISDMGVVINFN